MLRVGKYLLLLVAILTLILLGMNFWVILSTKNQVYHHASEIPSYKVGLILGTSKKTTEGVANKYFTQRILAAAKLYEQGKIKHIIVSGDNRTIYYNEPRDMYQALVKLGVPKDVITLDFAGLRTLDSILRSKKIFGQSKLIVITQRFHGYRALFIANYYDIKSIVYAAGENEALPKSLAVREILARVLAVLDLYVWNKEPAILGKQERIILSDSDFRDHLID